MKFPPLPPTVAFYLRGIDPDTKRKFKEWCRGRGYSMHEVLVHFMRKVVKDDRRLPLGPKPSRRKKRADFPGILPENE